MESTNPPECVTRAKPTTTTTTMQRARFAGSLLTRGVIRVTGADATTFLQVRFVSFRSLRRFKLRFRCALERRRRALSRGSRTPRLTEPPGRYVPSRRER